MTHGDGVPDDASPSQILLEMWIYAPGEVNMSEELTRSSQMAQVINSNEGPGSEGF